MILIFDIDDTLADLSHREHYVEVEGEEDWDTFFSDDEIIKDKVIDGAREGFNALCALADKVYIISGRPESALDKTEEWLIENDFDFDKVFGGIILRPSDKHMPAQEFKQAVMESIILPENDADEVYIFVDDDPENLEMFSEYGVALKAPEIWRDIVEEK